MQDHYATLGVSRDVTPSVAKIAFDGRMKRLAQGGLPEAERAAEERELQSAYLTLSNPAKKDWYDRKLDETDERRAAGSPPWVAGVVVACVLVAVAAGAYAWHARSQAREATRLQEELAASERSRAAMRAEADRAEAESARQAQAIEYLKTRDQGGRDLARESLRSTETARVRVDQQRQQVIDMAAQRERQRAEDIDRRRADEDLRKARAEVERQNRWVKQREAEEERARLQRARSR